MALKQSLLQIISCMLSPVADERLIAEERIKALEVTEEYAHYLFDIVIETEEPVEERQMAAILLKQFTLENWQTCSHDGTDPVINRILKQKLRHTLLAGLSLPISSIRNIVAVTVSNIASYDYPLEWPNMLDVLPWPVSGDNLQALGMLEFLKEYIAVAGDDQLYTSADAIYCKLFEIFNDNNYENDIRSKALYLFVKLLSINIMCNDIQTAKVIEKLVTAFATYINNANYKESDLNLLSEIIRALATLLVDYPSMTINFVSPVLPAIWNMLSYCSKQYEQMLCHSDELLPLFIEGKNEESDTFFKFIFNVFELIKCLLNITSSANSLLVVLNDLVAFTILFMAPNCDVQVVWLENQMLYFKEDSECWNEISLRYKSRDLFQSIILKFGNDIGLTALKNATEKYKTQLNGASYYWRTTEGLMYAISSIKHDIIRCTNENRLYGFDIFGYLTHWCEAIPQCPNSYMLARIISIGAQFSILLNEENMINYVTATLDCLKQDSFVLRYGALKALHSHICAIHFSSLRQIYLQLKQPTTCALIYTLEHASEELFQRGFMTLNEFLKLEGCNDEEIQNSILTLIIKLFNKKMFHMKNIFWCESVIMKMCTTKVGYGNVEAKMLPTLIPIVETIGKPPWPYENTVVPYETQLSALQLTWALTYYGPPPLSSDFVRQGFKAMYNCFMNNNDSVIRDITANCLRNFLLRAFNKICALYDGESHVGVLKLIKHILNTQNSALNTKPVVKLCIASISSLGRQADQYIESFIKQMLINISTSIKLEKTDNTILMFVYLFNTRLEQMLHFLTFIPGPKGQSALADILQTWLLKDTNLSDTFERNLNIQALARIFEHVVVTDDRRIGLIQICHREFKNGYVQAIYTPVPLRILKLLLRIVEKDLDEVRESDDDSDSRYFSDTESQHSFNGIYEKDSAVDRYEEIYNLNVQAFLKNFLRSQMHHINFSNYLVMLSSYEKNVLRSATDN